MYPDRRERLDAMIALLKQSDRGWTVKELARRFCLSERQIRRDLRDIQGEPDYAPLVTRCEVRREYMHMVTAYREKRRTK